MSYTFKTKIKYFKDHRPPKYPEFSCNFVITYEDGSEAKMHYAEPCICASAEWTDLSDNLFTPDYSRRLMFLDRNGCVYLSIGYGRLEFHTSQVDGSCAFSIKPTSQVQEELRKVVDAFYDESSSS